MLSWQPSARRQCQRTLELFIVCESNCLLTRVEDNTPSIKWQLSRYQSLNDIAAKWSRFVRTSAKHILSGEKYNYRKQTHNVHSFGLKPDKFVHSLIQIVFIIFTNVTLTSYHIIVLWIGNHVIIGVKLTIIFFPLIINLIRYSCIIALNDSGRNKCWNTRPTWIRSFLWF